MTLSPPMHDLSLSLHRLGFRAIDLEGEMAYFEVDRCEGFAYPAVGDRLRGSIVLEQGEGALEVVQEWVEAQPASRAGVLEVAGNPEAPDAWLLRVLFERPAAPELIGANDPLAEDCAVYASAWRDGSTITTLPSIERDFVLPGDPRDLAPRSAWLLLGDDASLPTDAELAEDHRLANSGVFEQLWTVAKQTEVGDLAFIYFTAPRKHVGYVTRVASPAFFDPTIGVNADGDVRDEQWWARLTPLIPVVPVPYATLRALHDDHLPLRGRSGKYLRPEVVDQLIEHIRRSSEVTPELDRVLHPVAGLADLPDPLTMTPQQWSDVSPGALRLEADVERYIVEPLLRFASPPGCRSERQYPAGGGKADYALVNDAGRAQSVIEVKLRVRRDRRGGWDDSADLGQVTRYARALDCPAVLIDCSQIHLIPRGGGEPYLTIDRHETSALDLDRIARHLA